MVKYKTIQLLEENMGEKNLQSLGLGKKRKFIDLTPKVRSIKGKIEKLDLVTIKNV